MYKISFQEYKSEYGELVIAVFENKLVMCDWKYRKMRDKINLRISRFLNAGFEKEDHPLIRQTIIQLEEYFRRERSSFEIPLYFCGSPFQKKIWKELLKIPYGTTVSYLQLSQKIGDEKAIRAVASANGANAISILVPCHRVIGSHGELTGYAGGVQVKHKLLTLEGGLAQLHLF